MDFHLSKLQDDGFHIIVNNREYFLSYEDFPWFKNQTKEDIEDVKITGSRLYWEKLDVDLTLEMIRHPDRFDLIAKVIQNPRVKEVEATDNYTLLLTFTSEENCIFDCKKYLDRGVFKELQDLDYFKGVKVQHGTVVWKNGQDLCPDTLYEECKNQRTPLLQKSSAKSRES